MYFSYEKVNNKLACYYFSSFPNIERKGSSTGETIWKGSLWVLLCAARVIQLLGTAPTGTPP